MRFRSTRDRSLRVSLRDAVLRGLAPDQGLYMPERIERLPATFFERAPCLAFADVADEVARALFGDDVPAHAISKIVRDAYDFDVPLKQLEKGLHVLELFHGPTLAFKDFAARFMARLMGSLIEGADRELNILVATSGDTGSAVAHGFHGTHGLQVFILYPSGKVSEFQERQLTTLGGNVTALEVEGTFDDCQRLVKTAFLDPELTSALWMSSANSINIARLLPQTFYYFFAAARLSAEGPPVVVSVPSGNYGNLTAGLLAKRMGAPIDLFIAAANANRAVPDYLATHHFSPRATIATISNAMDVGNPSNFERILDLYDRDHDRIAADVHGFSYDDAQTRAAMRELHRDFGHISEPHGAVAYLGATSHLDTTTAPVNVVYLATAHPAKFADIVEQETGSAVPMPDRVRHVMGRRKVSIKVRNDFDALKSLLLSLPRGGPRTS